MRAIAVALCMSSGIDACFQIIHSAIDISCCSLFGAHVLCSDMYETRRARWLSVCFLSLVPLSDYQDREEEQCLSKERGH